MQEENTLEVDYDPKSNLTSGGVAIAEAVPTQPQQTVSVAIVRDASSHPAVLTAPSVLTDDASSAPVSDADASSTSIGTIHTTSHLSDCSQSPTRSPGRCWKQSDIQDLTVDVATKPIQVNVAPFVSVSNDDAIKHTQSLLQTHGCYISQGEEDVDNNNSTSPESNVLTITDLLQHLIIHMETDILILIALSTMPDEALKHINNNRDLMKNIYAEVSTDHLNLFFKELDTPNHVRCDTILAKAKDIFGLKLPTFWPIYVHDRFKNFYSGLVRNYFPDLGCSPDIFLKSLAGVQEELFGHVYRKHPFKRQDPSPERDRRPVARNEEWTTLLEEYKRYLRGRSTEHIVGTIYIIVFFANNFCLD